LGFYLTVVLKKYLKNKEQEWEDLCIRCGGCCGSFDDPCVHLRKDKHKKYYCEIYETRLGLHKTVGGEEFNCVGVKEIIRTRWKNDHLCACKREVRSPKKRVKGQGPGGKED